MVTSAANPKLAVFFVALFPQFLSPGSAVLPAALAMGAVIVVYDRWANYFQRAVYDDHGKVTPMDPFKPF